MNTELRLLDSATRVSDADAGHVVVTASHGGLYAAFLVARRRVRAAVFNDAGVGFDGAGIEGLDYLEKIGIAAVTVSHQSARIGDAQDTLARGVVSYINAPAAALGCSPGQPCGRAAQALKSASLFHAAAPPVGEARTLLVDGPVRVWGLDSAALVAPADVGAIIIAGSHGGLVGGRPENALQVDAIGAVFHDAGLGIDNAGIGRLAPLDARNIAAATVAADSARIGDAKSMWAAGRISHVNQTARKSGARPGMSVRAFARDIAAGHIRQSSGAKHDG